MTEHREPPVLPYATPQVNQPTWICSEPRLRLIVPPPPLWELLLFRALGLLLLTPIALLVVVGWIALYLDAMDQRFASPFEYLLMILALVVCWGWYSLARAVVQILRFGRLPARIEADDRRLMVEHTRPRGQIRLVWEIDQIRSMTVNRGTRSPWRWHDVRMHIESAHGTIDTLDLWTREPGAVDSVRGRLAAILPGVIGLDQRPMDQTAPR